MRSKTIFSFGDFTMVYEHDVCDVQLRCVMNEA